MIQPPYLKQGDTVAIVATARKVSREEMRPAIAFLTQHGLKVVEAPHLYHTDHQFAGTDEQRASDIQWAIDEPEVKAVLCARGGYGTIRTLDKVNFKSLIDHPKWISGFSDVTILLSHLAENVGVEGLHGPMAIQFTEPYYDEESSLRLVRTWMGKPEKISAQSDELNRAGKAEGTIVGGNLSMIYSAMGTPYEVNTRGRILFLEDLDEYLYHIDRIMMNLKTAGKLEHLKGLVIGSMTKMNDNAIPFGKEAKEIIYHAVSGKEFPVAFNFPCGHEKHNYPLIMGRKYELNVNETGSELVPA